MAIQAGEVPGLPLKREMRSGPQSKFSNYSFWVPDFLIIAAGRNWIDLTSDSHIQAVTQSLTIATCYTLTFPVPTCPGDIVPWCWDSQWLAAMQITVACVYMGNSGIDSDTPRTPTFPERKKRLHNQIAENKPEQRQYPTNSTLQRNNHGTTLKWEGI